MILGEIDCGLCDLGPRGTVAVTIIIYAIFLGVSPPWVTLELLFGKKYRTLGIMKHEMRNEMK